MHIYYTLNCMCTSFDSSFNFYLILLTVSPGEVLIEDGTFAWGRGENDVSTLTKYTALSYV